VQQCREAIRRWSNDAQENTVVALARDGVGQPEVHAGLSAEGPLGSADLIVVVPGSPPRLSQEPPR
jgi:hypothetical protein